MQGWPITKVTDNGYVKFTSADGEIIVNFYGGPTGDFGVNVVTDGVAESFKCKGVYEKGYCIAHDNDVPRELAPFVCEARDAYAALLEQRKLEAAAAKAAAEAKAAEEFKQSKLGKFLARLPKQ